ncbi:MAG: cytochrome c3 family protein [Desulfobulbales bacterium]|nr:cytochrome c3 family protein [Desulfobulbales bacterium]
MEKFCKVTLCLVIVMGIFLPQKLFAESVLQISSGPGVSIWLNKNFIGKTTSAQNGLLITDLDPGEYALRASMPGYDDVETVITVSNYQTIEWRITLAEPVLRVEDSVRRIESAMIRSKPTGTIVLQSLPLSTQIFFDGKAIGPGDKKLTHVPAAEHTVTFVLQKQELADKILLKEDEAVLLKADFTSGKVVRETAQTDTKLGPVVIKMQTSRKKKPALFPHRKHQQMYGCEECHHGMDSEGNQVPYIEGMAIQHCVTCHNPTMKNKKLSSLTQAAHARCKGCHKKVVAESGKAGPIGKCSGCHIDEKDN